MSGCIWAISGAHISVIRVERNREHLTSRQEPVFSLACGVSPELHLWIEVYHTEKYVLGRKNGLTK